MRCSAALPDNEIIERARNTQLIVTDVDGTLLNSSQQLTLRTEQAVKAAQDAGVPTIVATGKTRGPWSKDVLPRLGPPMPGIFVQGLLIYDEAGEIIYSNPLPDHIALEGIQFAKKHGVSLIAFCQDRILCESEDEHTDRTLDFGEPRAEAMGPLEDVLGEVEMHKLILMGEESTLERIRPEAEALFEGRAALTVAVPGMLEILPKGASKGQAVEWLLNHMKIDPSNVMAFGDGENDVEMLRLVGASVSVENAGTHARSASITVTASNDEDGVAQAIEKFVLAPRNILV
eukprot:CAMPEP_0118940056 /NCGR_PEP_ID=MMETSP1169-20130426/30491_1 /TAXON_ID=36882 /ORGANISM="Pyramimonas obovata, Strain CCMP722" /LENGTH=288 /DNA_ID=CAMNT_0006884453 /DNA_START=76 /DNA_END=942 /DNA_ORIENTATION=-